MIEVGQVLECKQLAAQEVPIREISRRLGISRNTVRRYLRGAPAGVYVKRQRRARPVRDGLYARVREMLESEKRRQTKRKQRLTASRIHRILTREGVRASERSVRALVREVKSELRDPLEAAYLPLSYKPGVDAQVDFFEGEVDDKRLGRCKCFILLVRACYSRRVFAHAAPNQTQEALFMGLLLAFEFFGGVFRHLWFDNLTPAVRRVLQGRARDVQKAFAAFQAHYGFKAEFCAPGKGNEKGGVENAVKFARSEILSPIPVVEGRAGLQELCDAYMREQDDRTVRGSPVTIGEAWRHEQAELMPLPPDRFEACKVRKAKVSNRSWVQSGTCFYSVPVQLCGKHVTVKSTAEEIIVLDDEHEVARHPRSYERGRMLLRLEHDLPLLARKHRGLDRALPVRMWLTEAPSCWSAFLALLRREHGEIEGSKQFVATLELVGVHGLDRVSRAVRQSFSDLRPSVTIVRTRVEQAVEVARGPAPQSIPLRESGPEVHQGSIAAYDELCGSREVPCG